VGEVVAVPPSEHTWKIGQIVGSGWHGGHDGTCQRCRRGDFMTCRNQNINGQSSFLNYVQSLTVTLGISRDGGYAQYATLRTEAVATIPEGLDHAEVAPQFCAGITVFSK
jgi:D-arabinose 1-dehydrogenase-like Zn-dependent alcohol dehydrogenase